MSYSWFFINFYAIICTTKSSLIKCLRTVGFYEKFLGFAYNVRDVDQHKVGVIPSDFRSRKFGRIVFYDLAGGRDCIQNDLIQSRTDVARSVFIVLIDFRDEREEMEDKMAFWMSFIYHQCEKYWSPKTGQMWPLLEALRM